MPCASAQCRTAHRLWLVTLACASFQATARPLLVAGRRQCVAPTSVSCRWQPNVNSADVQTHLLLLVQRLFLGLLKAAAISGWRQSGVLTRRITIVVIGWRKKKIKTTTTNNSFTFDCVFGIKHNSVGGFGGRHCASQRIGQVVQQRQRITLAAFHHKTRLQQAG